MKPDFYRKLARGLEIVSVCDPSAYFEIVDEKIIISTTFLTPNEHEAMLTAGWEFDADEGKYTFNTENYYE